MRRAILTLCCVVLLTTPAVGYQGSLFSDQVRRGIAGFSFRFASGRGYLGQLHFPAGLREVEPCVGAVLVEGPGVAVDVHVLREGEGVQEGVEVVDQCHVGLEPRDQVR